MKKLLLIAVMILGIQMISIAQVTKADYDNLLKINQTSMDKITTIYIGNNKTFYTDGSWKWTDSKYKSVNGDYKNEFFLTDNGILIKISKSGQIAGSEFFPFASIKKTYVTATSIDIHLVE